MKQRPKRVAIQGIQSIPEDTLIGRIGSKGVPMTLTEQEYECLIRNAMRRLDSRNVPDPDIERAQARETEASKKGFRLGGTPGNDANAK